jgi:hypothetical protein
MKKNPRRTNLHMLQFESATIVDKDAADENKDGGEDGGDGDSDDGMP